MDLIKIGKFISSKRKEKNITQSELAEKLSISDRAISKWENGICLPDAGNMSELCKILGITINDLFSGEVVDMENNEKKYEENLLELAKEKEKTDKQLLNIEILLGFVGVVFFLGAITIASYIEMPEGVRLAIIIPAWVLFIIICLTMLIIEQKAGYYECGECHHKYVPEYKKMLWAPHMGRTRYMKCPKCGMKSWQKKVIK